MAVILNYVWDATAQKWVKATSLGQGPSPGPALSDSAPSMAGTAAAGSAATAARGDHVHPSDTSRLPVLNPVAQGRVKVESNTADLTLQRGDNTAAWRQILSGSDLKLQRSADNWATPVDVLTLHAAGGSTPKLIPSNNPSTRSVLAYSAASGTRWEEPTAILAWMQGLVVQSARGGIYPVVGASTSVNILLPGGASGTMPANRPIQGQGTAAVFRGASGGGGSWSMYSYGGFGDRVATVVHCSLRLSALALGAGVNDGPNYTIGTAVCAPSGTGGEVRLELRTDGKFMAQAVNSGVRTTLGSFTPAADTWYNITVACGQYTGFVHVTDVTGATVLLVQCPRPTSTGVNYTGAAYVSVANPTGGASGDWLAEVANVAIASTLFSPSM